MLIIIDLKLILTELSFFEDELSHPIFFCNFDKNKVMSAQELKLNLLDKLASVTDENLLNQIHNLLKNIDVNVNSYKMNNEQINMVQESESNYQAGRTSSNQSVFNEDSEWLKNL
jgi:hypothetical protein